MCESKNLAQSGRSGFKGRNRSNQIIGWVGTVVSLAALVSSTGCSLSFGRHCRCCCHTSCSRPSQVTDQYSSWQAYRNHVPQKIAEPVARPIATPQPQVKFENVKFESPRPKIVPIQSITASESTNEAPKDESIWSNLQPEAIDDMVDKLFERSQRRASGFSDLPVGEDIETNSTIKDVVEELSNESSDDPQPAAPEPVISDSSEEESPQPSLSMAPEEPVAIVAQLPADSVARPFAEVQLPAPVDDKIVLRGPGSRISVNDQNVFELDRLPKLQAVPVDKRHQRRHGIPLSNEPVTNPRSNLSFLPDSNSSMLVLPGGSPRALTPLIQLEAMDFRGKRPLPPVNGESTEAQSTLPRIHEVLR